jgi:hypothetical protein
MWAEGIFVMNSQELQTAFHLGLKETVGDRFRRIKASQRAGRGVRCSGSVRQPVGIPRLIVRPIACSVVGQKSLDHASDQGAAVGIGSHQGIPLWLVFRG